LNDSPRSRIARSMSIRVSGSRVTVVRIHYTITS
jgi:hypothetical protein